MTVNIGLIFTLTIKDHRELKVWLFWQPSAFYFPLNRHHHARCGRFFLCNKKKASTEAFFFTVLPYYRARYVDLVVLVDDAPEYILRDYQLNIPISIHAPLWVRQQGL